LEFDVRTILVTQAGVAVALAVAMAFAWRLHRGTPGIGLWTIALAVGALGIALLILRERVAPVLSVVVACSLVVAAPIFTWNGIRAFAGQRPNWIVPGALFALFVAAIIYWTFVAPSFSARLALISFAIAVGYAPCAIIMLRIDTGERRLARFIAAFSFGVIAINSGVRTITSLGSPPDGALFAASPLQATFFMIGTVNLVLATFSLMMLTSQKLQSEVEQRNRELSLLARDLDMARLRAEQANKSKSQFLATMSHELRTPLNAIIGFADLGRTLPLPATGEDRIREYFGHILWSGSHLLDLINDILDLSKAEAGKLEIAPMHLDLAPVMTRSVTLVREQAASRAQSLLLEIIDPLPIVYADKRALERIVFNLASNAIKFTPEGGTITIRACEIAGGGVEIAVSDTGIGIEAGDIDRLMKPFERIDNGYSRSTSGTGLGLPIVDTLVRLHGGHFRLESVVGRGTVASVRLPPAPPLALSA
jgi:signal transduction histidine kinase